MQILIADDDEDLVELLRFALQRAGLSTLPAHDSTTALRLIDEARPDLAIIDVNIGPRNGFELLKEIRSRTDIPVIVLSGRSSERDKVRALGAGADDYVTKPFSHRELIARIMAMSRRAGRPVEPGIPSSPDSGPLVLNRAEYSAFKEGRRLNLTATEFRLLGYLVANAGRVVTLKELSKEVWGYEDARAVDVVRVTIYRLRRKLDDQSGGTTLLHTLRGIGVMFKASAS